MLHTFRRSLNDKISKCIKYSVELHEKVSCMKDLDISTHNNYLLKARMGLVELVMAASEYKGFLSFVNGGSCFRPLTKLIWFKSDCSCERVAALLSDKISHLHTHTHINGMFFLGISQSTSSRSPANRSNTNNNYADIHTPTRGTAPPPIHL